MSGRTEIEVEVEVEAEVVGESGYSRDERRRRRIG